MISAVPLTHVSTEDAAAWHAVVAASLAGDLPQEPRPTFEQVHAQLTVTGRDNRRLLWQATATDGAVVGVAALRLFTSPAKGTWRSWSCMSPRTDGARASARTCWPQPWRRHGPTSAAA